MKGRVLMSGLAVLVAILAISCGGGGISSTFSPTTREVQNIQRYSMLSMTHSGFGFFGFGVGAGGGGGTGGSGGMMGGSFGSIGGFVRGVGSPGGLAYAARTPAGGTTSAGGGGTGGSDFYFDEWLQLWVEMQWTETEFSCLFYLDEAKSLPAGHILSTFTGNWETYPQTCTSDYEFTAGPWAGSHGAYNCVQTNQFVGEMTYNDTYVDRSHDAGSASWTEAGSTWQSRWDGANGNGWYEDHGDWTWEGSGTWSCASSEGWATLWRYNADGSGTAHFEGPDPKLPADMRWTADGHFRIDYADGTHEEWSWNELWLGGGEGGTSGGGFGISGPGAAR